MNCEVNSILMAADLPEKWDVLAVDYFQTREFLSYSEKYNPCRQRYYTLSKNSVIEAGAVVYTLKIDLFTYLRIPSPMKMNILGIPCSVSSGGIIGDTKWNNDLFEYLRNHEKGLLLALNLDSELISSKVVTGRTLPTIELKNTFPSWESYVHSLRADYRRRYMLLSSSFSGISKKRDSCSQFDNNMYRQYLEVLKHSKGKLETLSKNFFSNLPSSFSLTAYYDRDTLIGWYISTEYKSKFYFFMGGIDYDKNRQFNTYLNILFGVLKEGIEKKASLIDLGQTAEISKTRLGGKVVEKFMIGHHSNWILYKLLKAGKSMMEYSTIVPETNVTRKDL